MVNFLLSCGKYNRGGDDPTFHGNVITKSYFVMFRCKGKLLYSFPRCEAETIRQWQSKMEPELRTKLKQPLLVS